MPQGTPTVPAIDLLPEMPLSPLPDLPPTPPAPVTPPPLSPSIKEGLKQGVPVTQETNITQTLYRGRPTGGIAPTEMPGTTKKSIPCIQYLAALCNEAQSVGFSVEILRKGPPVWRGVKLPFATVERIDQVAPYPDIYDRVKELHGGGSYELKVLNGDGYIVHRMPFNIDTVSCPPKIAPADGGNGGGFLSSPFGGIGGEADEIMQARQEEQKARAVESKIIAQARVERTARQIDKERQAERDADERRALGPVHETQRIVDTLRGEMKDQKHESDRRMDLMISSLEKLLLTMAGTKNNGGDQMVMAEIMKASMQSQAQMLAAVISASSGKGGELSEAMKIQSEANRQMVQMAIQSAAGAGPKYEKLVEQLVMHKIEHPDNAVRQAIELMESGSKKTLDMVRMIEEARGDREPGEPVINPENGFFGNLGNLLLRGVEGMVTGAAKGGGGKVIDMLAAQMMKPAAGQVLPSMPMPQGQRPLLPGPQAGPVPMPQAQPRISLPRFEHTYDLEDEPVVPVATAVPQPGVMAPVAEPSFATPPYVAPIEAPPQPQQSQAQAAPMEETVDDNEVDRTREVVNEAVQMAITDIKAGRRAHDWVDFALDKWDRVLLTSLIQAKDDTERIALLQQFADPKLFEELVKLLMDTTHPENYKGFMENVQMLLEEATKEVVGA